MRLSFFGYELLLRRAEPGPCEASLKTEQLNSGFSAKNEAYNGLATPYAFTAANGGGMVLGRPVDADEDRLRTGVYL